MKKIAVANGHSDSEEEELGAKHIGSTSIDGSHRQSNKSTMNKTRRDMLWCLFTCGCILILIMLTAILLYYLRANDDHNHNNNDNNNNKVVNKENAEQSLSKLMQSNTNITMMQNILAVTAFKILDDDSDGYLNQEEFVEFFQIALKHSNVFEEIDINGDYIWSYRELVAYLKAINSIHDIHSIYVKKFAMDIQERYHFNYNESQSDDNKNNNELFYEYLTLLLYFENNNIAKLNGYIDYKNFLQTNSKNEFNEYDEDKDGKISQTEFFNILFGSNKNSWNYELRNMYGDNYKEILRQLNEIKIIENEVNSINIKLCPLQLMQEDININNNNTKQERQQRRLQRRDDSNDGRFDRDRNNNDRRDDSNDRRDRDRWDNNDHRRRDRCRVRWSCGWYFRQYRCWRVIDC